jgi:Flp pilus assembly protein TadB
MLPNMLIFGAGAMAVFAIYSLVADLFLPDPKVADRFKQDFRKETRERVKQSKLFKEGNPAAALSELTRPTFRNRTETLLLQAGLDVPFEQFMAKVAIIAAVAGPAAPINRANACGSATRAPSRASPVWCS